MNRFLTICMMIAFAVGCQGQRGNPFMRTTVPPPGTGAAAAAPGGDYYGATQPPAISVPGSAAPAGTMAPGGVAPGPVAPVPVVPPPEKRYTAPGGYNFPQGSVVPRKAVDPNPREYRAGTAAIARGARPRSSAGPHADTNQQLASVQPAVETATPDAQAAEQEPEATPAAAIAPLAASESTDSEVTSAVAKSEPIATPSWQEETSVSEPTKFGSSHGTGGASLRIVTPQAEGAEVASNLSDNATVAADKGASSFTAAKPTETTLAVAPAVATSSPAGITASSERPGPRRYFDRARPVSFTAATETAKNATGSAKPTAENSASYAHDDGYNWLRGKLEYSAAARRWKLRYIPIDGQTDTYGGSVVLPEAASLEGFRPGEFVTVHGTVGKEATASGTFSPRYDLERIERQGG